MRKHDSQLSGRSVVLLAAFVGCGVNGAPGGGGPIVSPAGGAFEDQFAHAWCDNLASCCQADTPPFSASTCLSHARMIAGGFAADAAEVSGGSVQFNPSQVDRCLAAVTASALSCPTSAPLMFALAQNSIGEPCANVFSLSSGPGAACQGFFASECAPPVSGYAGCSQEGGGGMCQQTTFVGLGQPCATDIHPADSVCDPSLNLFCDQTTRVCAPPAGAGEPCTDLPCDAAAGLLCVTSGTGSLCQPPPQTGGSCVGYPDGACPSGTYCDNVCLPLGTDGAFCGGSGACAPTYYCVGGECAPRLPDGAACTTSDACPVTSYCAKATGLCAPLVGRGQPCSLAEETDPCVVGTTCTALDLNDTISKPADQIDAICATWFYRYFCAP